MMKEATGLANNHTLKDLKLKLVHSTSDFSWQAIFTALHSTLFRSEKLDMTGNGDNNASAIVFSNDSLPNVSMFYRITDKILSESTAILLSDALLHHSTTLRTLTFNEDDGKLFRRNDGWLVISQLMLNPNSELKLSDNSITTEGLENLTNVLITNSRLRILNLGKNHAVPVGGWIAFFHVLRNPNSALEELLLYDITRINGYFLICLADALTSNCKLRKLFLSEALHRGNNEIPSNGWVTFSAVLRNPNSALEELSLHNIYVNDTVRISLVEALSSNQKLKNLFTHWIEHNDWGDDADSDDDIESNQPVALCLTRILCNNQSILSTFHSNHTLEKIFIKDEKYNDYDDDPEYWLPKDVVSLLRINRDNSKNQAARLKIIHTHFSGHEIIMEPFMRCA
jgi:hypothetical protein